MKRKIYFLMAAIMLSFTVSSTAMAKETNPAAMTEAQKEVRYQEMKNRVEEIKAMDKSQLNRDERKALKAELKQMNKEAQVFGKGGVYLSVGAIIIIILVLILIL